MTDVNSAVSTQIAKGSQASAQGQGAAALSGGQGIFANLNGLSFWDLILSPGTGNENASLQTKQNTETSLRPLLQNALSQEDAIENLEDSADSLFNLILLAQGKEITLEDLKTLRPDQFQKKIDGAEQLVERLSLTLPDQEQAIPALDALLSKLQQKIEDLQAKLDSITQESQALGAEQAALLIALGLSPTDLSAAAQRIEDIEKKLGRTLTAEDLVAGVGSIVKSVQDDTQKSSVAEFVLLKKPHNAGPNEVVSLSPSSIPTDSASVQDAPVTLSTDPLADDNTPSDDLAAQLNDIIVGSGPDGATTDENAGLTNGVQGESLQDENSGDNNGDGTPVISAGNNQGTAQKGKNNAALNAGQIKASGQVLQNASEQAWANAQGVPFTFNGTYPEDGDFDVYAGLPMTQSAQAAHAITQATQSAGQTHPATQMVSTQISKAAMEGGPKQMTIQLDPPELGRVNIELEFGPDKTVKAHMLVEKPETLGLLQRDTAILERALLNAGMQTDSNGLSFELAQDNTAFDGTFGDNQQGNAHGHANGQNANGNEQNDNTNSTMTWYVDPNTGRTHYDILA